MTQPCIYIMTNKQHGTLYIGFTNNLVHQVRQHRFKRVAGISQKLSLCRLVYFEPHSNMKEAMLRQRQMTKKNKDWKFELIEKENPHWEDLWSKIQ